MATTSMATAILQNCKIAGQRYHRHFLTFFLVTAELFTFYVLPFGLLFQWFLSTFDSLYFHVGILLNLYCDAFTSKYSDSYFYSHAGLEYLFLSHISVHNYTEENSRRNMYWHVTQVFTVWKTYEAFFWDLLNIWNMYWTLLEDYVEVSYVDQYNILRVE